MGNGDEGYMNGARHDEVMQRFEVLVEKSDTIAEHTSQLPGIADEMRNLNAEIRLMREDLVHLLSNRIPQGSIPIESHKELIATLNDSHKALIKSLSWAWGCVIVAALTIMKIAPSVYRAIPGHENRPEAVTAP